MEPTDYELISKYRGGQVEALAELVERHKRVLFGYIINMTEGSGDADEIFQEVWFKVIKKISTYKHKNFRGWLMRIAHNTVIDRARRKKPVVSLDKEDDVGNSLVEVIPTAEAGPGKLLERGEMLHKIQGAVDLLPLVQKEVFVMRVKGMTFKEIAKAQKVSINTALARMQYATSRLQLLLKDDYGDKS